MSKQVKVSYEIDKGVPIKVSLARKNPPLSTLEVGESVAFDLDRRKAVQSYASRLKRKTGKKFTIHKESDTEARVWRVE